MRGKLEEFKKSLPDKELIRDVIRTQKETHQKVMALKSPGEVAKAPESPKVDKYEI